MSELKNQILEAVKTAMRAREKTRLAALRLLQAAIKQKEVDERISLEDEDVRKVLNKLAKQRQDSIKQFAAAGRDDLVTKENYELELIRSFLPVQISSDELMGYVQRAVATTGASSLKDMGKVMAALKKELPDQDMGVVSSLVKECLASASH